MALEVGRSIDIVGVLAAPYGQLEVRELEWLALGAIGAAPAPIAATLPEIGERLEGSLVTLEGTIDSVTVDSGRLVLTIGDKQTELRVLADPPSGISKADVTRGEQATLTGIVGQRATALGREDGYRLWLRMPSDLTAVVARRRRVRPARRPPPGPRVRPQRPRPCPSITIWRPDSRFGVAPWTWRPRSRPRPESSTGAARRSSSTTERRPSPWSCRTESPARGPAPASTSSARRAAFTADPGSWPRSSRGAATAWQCSRARSPARSGRRSSGSSSAVCGRVQRLTRAGSRWRADLAVDGQTVAVLGEPGAGINPAGIVAGRLALATGIVRRSTSDSSVFQLLPRSAADLILGPAPASAASGRSAGAAAAGQASASGASGASAATDAPITVAEIPGHEGETVTVAGLIVDTGPATATLDDGTGRVRLGGAAASDALSLLEPGDAVEVTGLVSRDADGWLIEVDPYRIVTLAGTGLGRGGFVGRSSRRSLPLRRGGVGRPGIGGRGVRGTRPGPRAGAFRRRDGRPGRRSRSSPSSAAAWRWSPFSGSRPPERPEGRRLRRPGTARAHLFAAPREARNVAPR